MATTKKYNWTSSSDYQKEINSRVKERDAIKKPGDFQNKYTSQEESINSKLDKDYYSRQADLNKAILNYSNAANYGVDLSKNTGYQQEYNNYVNDYTRRGERAMKDTLGKLASRTGGLASSYATAVAQQAYSQYMDELANKVTDLGKDYRAQTFSALENLRDYLTNDKSREQTTLNNALNNYINMDKSREGEYKTNLEKYKTEVSLIDALIQELAGQRSTSLSKEQHEADLELEREKLAQQRELAEQAAQRARQTSSSSGRSSSGGSSSSSSSNYSAPEQSDRIWVDGTAFGLSELLRGEAEGWFTRDANGNWKSVPKYDSRGFRLTNPYTGR